MLSYSSWAAQARLGHFTFGDLFTTEAHPEALFNLYFLAIGWLSRIVGLEPLHLMAISSFVLAPVAVFAILRIARELDFDRFGQVLSLLFVLLGSGPSGLLILLDAHGLQPLSPGADGYYLDLFPLASLVFYPYHASTFVLLALVVLKSSRLFAAADKPGAARRATLLGLLFLITGFVRPYEAVTLAAVFNLTALFEIFAIRRAPFGRIAATCCIVDLLAIPPIAYAAFMATRPVWGSFAEYSMIFETGGIGSFLKGFAILWAFAGLGLVFAIRDRNRALSFVACWAIASAALLLLSPSYGTKFAGGIVLPNGLLAAYGISRLLQERATPARRRTIWRIAGCAIGVMALTPLVDFVDVLQVGAPKKDTELLAAGRRIREFEGTRIPVVLTDPDAGSVLAGLLGERVYAGHWSLTLGYRKKSQELKRAGVDASAGSAASYDRSLLAELVRDSHADYVLLSRSAPAAPSIAACSPAKPIFESGRWIAVSTKGWACR
jgi:hypothetical protein